MASNYTGLGVQLMTTGEKAGLWGGYTNTNWEIMEQIAGGYLSVAITSTPTTLAVADGTSGDTNQVAHRVIEFTGSIGEATIVTIPLDVQTFYIIKNSSSGAYTVQFKYVTGSGNSVAIANGDTVLVYATANDVTNPDIDDTGFAAGDVTLTGTQTLTNKTLTSPKIGTNILDTGGNELINLTATGSAVNELTIANAATGVAGPVISATGEANVGININPAGTGVLKSGSNAVKIAGLETIWVPSASMYPTTTNGCADLEQTELTANQPELKSLDFDDSADEFAQFAVAFPKSWNLGTVTFEPFWTSAGTNTGACIWAVEGYAASNADAINTAFGTEQTSTDSHSGTANDLDVGPTSSAITIAGTPADEDQVFFQIYRDANAGGDTLTGDAKLLGIKLYFTTDAANDA